MYALAVPVWLIATDGVFLAELGVEGVFTRIQRKKGIAVRAPLARARRSRLLDAFVTAILSIAGHLPRGAAPASGELRRHVILNGLDPHYGTEKASVQGILLLEVLHFHLEASRPLNPPSSL